MVSFSLSENEEKEYKAFQEKHTHFGIKGGVCGNVTLEFTPGGIGTIVCAKCSICHQEENITDYSCW